LPCGRWNSTESSSGHSTGACRRGGGGARRRGDVAVVGAAEDREDRVDEEDELAAGAQEARRLGDPAVGVAPELAPYSEIAMVEGAVGIGDLLGVAVEEREVEAELLLVGACGGELRFAVVDPDRAGPRRASQAET